MPDDVFVPLGRVDIARQYDRVLLMAVLILVLAATLIQPVRLALQSVIILLLFLSWLVPKLLQRRHRDLARSATVVQPVALQFRGNGSLGIQWAVGNACQPVGSYRVLWLGPLLQITLYPSIPSLHPVPSAGAPLVRSDTSSTRSCPDPLLGRSASPVLTTAGARQGLARGLARSHHYLLWLPALNSADRAALRRWLLWLRRGGPS
ncbi:MAG: hypothetical protein Q4B13_08505 [Lautropia sp.]|nr:hypothetical protein [Lautropia sp.]